METRPAPGSSPESSSRSLRPLEWLALLHAGGLLLLATWGFGGGIGWVRTALTYAGLPAIVLLLAHVVQQTMRSGSGLRTLHWLWPLVAFNAFVVAAGFTPSFREMMFGTETMLVQNEVPSWRPSSARPWLAVRELALFDALFIPCFNLALILRSRRALRGLMLFAGANALLLAIFGTVQKLMHAKGLYFGVVKSPQVYFFASFIYHNHWGAFITLMVASCLALVWHYARRNEGRGFFHTPAFGGLLAVILLAATVPLSGSRSCTLALAAFFFGALLHVVSRFVRRRRHRSDVTSPLIGVLAVFVLGAAGVWFVAHEMIAVRFAKTREQISEMRQQGTIGSRAVLYRDTWRMGQEKIWYGWGMASYPHVFMLFNTQKSAADRLPVFYADAHNDWLQSIAEHGIVGTALLALCAGLPLAGLRKRHLRSFFPIYLLAGCALLVLYAWVEFPFGNAAVVFTWWLCFFTAVRYARLDSSSHSPAR